MDRRQECIDFIEIAADLRAGPLNGVVIARHFAVGGINIVVVSNHSKDLGLTGQGVTMWWTSKQMTQRPDLGNGTPQ